MRVFEERCCVLCREDKSLLFLFRRRRVTVCSTLGWQLKIKGVRMM